MTADLRDIAIVLDTTALTAWARESVAVGELIAEIEDDHGAVLVPMACLVEAAYRTGMLAEQRLRMLLDLPTVFLVVDDPEDWPALAATRNLVERADLAAAAWLAVDAQVQVMTSDPRWYSAVNGGRDVLTFEPGE